MVADKSAEVSDMFRFGMQMQMPKCLDQINYYGRGPIENYSDRNNVTDLGNYRQTVDEQFYSYIRPQETGTKRISVGGNRPTKAATDSCSFRKLRSRLQP